MDLSLTQYSFELFFSLASVWQLTLLLVFAVRPKTKLNCSGSATPSYNRSLHPLWPNSQFKRWSGLFATSCTAVHKGWMLHLLRLCFTANTSTWAFHPTSCWSSCWGGPKQISGKRRNSWKQHRHKTNSHFNHEGLVCVSFLHLSILAQDYWSTSWELGQSGRGDCIRDGHAAQRGNISEKKVFVADCFSKHFLKLFTISYRVNFTWRT